MISIFTEAVACMFWNDRAKTPGRRPGTMPPFSALSWCGHQALYLGIEAMAYWFHGQKTLEAAAGLVDNRVRSDRDEK